MNSLLFISHTHTHTHNHFTALWILSGITWVSQYQKGKTNLVLLKQETVSSSGISWPCANLHLAPDR